MKNPLTVIKTDKLINYISREQENKKSRRLSEIGFTLLVIALFAFLAIKPTFSKISELMGTIKSKKMLSAEMEKKIRSIVQAQDNFAKIQDEYPLIQSCIPSYPSFSNASSLIQKSGERNSIAFQKINFNLDQDKNIETGNFHINTSSQGDFLAFLQTIDQLSKSRRPLTIDTFSFSIPKSQSSASPSASQINFSINTEFYFLEKYDKK